MVGGGIQDKMLCRFTAEATGRKVVAGPVEGTAIGNLLIQAYALGEVKDLTEIRQVVKNSVPLETYEPANRDAWDKAYEEFLRVTK